MDRWQSRTHPSLSRSIIRGGRFKVTGAEITLPLCSVTVFAAVSPMALSMGSQLILDLAHQVAVQPLGAVSHTPEPPPSLEER